MKVGHCNLILQSLASTGSNYLASGIMFMEPCEPQLGMRQDLIDINPILVPRVLKAWF